MDDLILLLEVLRAHDEKIEGRKRFQKIVFLLKEKYKIPFSYRFLKYYFGPYSYELQMDLSNLIDMGYKTEKYDGLMYSYELTEKGKETLDSLLKENPHLQERSKKLNKIIKKLKKIETYKLVEEAYKVMERMGGS